MLKSYSTTMVLRVRMPISDDLAPRNFITKIVRYDRVVNVPNSMTVLEEMMPASVAMAEAKLCGIYNFCNPGAVSHNEILDMYKEIVDRELHDRGAEQDPRGSVAWVGARGAVELCCRRRTRRPASPLPRLLFLSHAPHPSNDQPTPSSQPSGRTTSWMQRS